MIDPTSPTWAAVKAFCISEIEGAQRRLENDLEEKETTQLRARIRTLREVLKMAEPKPVIASPKFV